MFKNPRININHFYSVLFSLYLLVPPINKIVLVYFSFLPFSLMSVLYLTIGILIISCFFIGKNRIKEIGKANFFIFIAVLIYFLVSSLRGVTGLSVFELVVYFAIPILFFSKKSFDFNTFIKTALIVSVFGLPIVNSIFVLDYNGIAEMGVSYAFLLPAIIPVYYLIRHKNKSFIFAILSILNLVYDIQIFLHGSRGCAISILTLFFLLLIFNLTKRKSITAIKYKLIIGTLILVILIINFVTVMDFFKQTLSSFGISASTLDKLFSLVQRGDVSNGRNEIYKIAFDGFLGKPLFGNGFDSFDYYTGLEYPHNFVIQLLYDLGIIGVMIIFVPFLFGTIKMTKRLSKEDLYFFIVVFSSSVPGALFSQNAWKNVLLWITISMAVSYFGTTEVTVSYDKKVDKKIAVS